MYGTTLMTVVKPFLLSKCIPGNYFMRLVIRKSNGKMNGDYKLLNSCVYLSNAIGLS